MYAMDLHKCCMQAYKTQKKLKVVVFEPPVKHIFSMYDGNQLSKRRMFLTSVSIPSPTLCAVNSSFCFKQQQQQHGTMMVHQSKHLLTRPQENQRSTSRANLFERAFHVDALVPGRGRVGQAVAGVAAAADVDLLAAERAESLGHHQHAVVR